MGLPGRQHRQVAELRAVGRDFTRSEQLIHEIIRRRGTQLASFREPPEFRAITEGPGDRLVAPMGQFPSPLSLFRIQFLPTHQQNLSRVIAPVLKNGEFTPILIGRIISGLRQILDHPFGNHAVSRFQTIQQKVGDPLRGIQKQQPVQQISNNVRKLEFDIGQVTDNLPTDGTIFHAAF